MPRGTGVAMTEIAVPVRPDEFEAVARVVVVWPQPVAGGALDGWKMVILDADTEEMITTITRLMVCSDPEDVVWARARMLVNADGEPIIHRGLGPLPPGLLHVGADGHVAEADFDLWVTEMRVAGVDAP